MGSQEEEEEGRRKSREGEKGRKRHHTEEDFVKTGEDGSLQTKEGGLQQRLLPLVLKMNQPCGCIDLELQVATAIQQQSLLFKPHSHGASPRAILTSFLMPTPPGSFAHP